MAKDEATMRERYGPWAVVAGASEGLGEEFAIQLAARGFNLILIARREQVLALVAEAIIREYGIKVRQVVLDLSSDDVVETLKDHTDDINVGMLVYNAGYSLIGPFFSHSLEDHVMEVHVNCRSPLALAYHFGKSMVERGRGGILLMSSMAGYQGSPLLSNYGATKAYTQLLAEGLWDELRAQGVDVLACCAGATNTPNFQASSPDQSSFLAPPVMDPLSVVAEALDALGRTGSFTPGRGNRVAAFFMRRVLPRKMAVTIMGNNMRKLYGNK